MCGAPVGALVVCAHAFGYRVRRAAPLGIGVRCATFLLVIHSGDVTASAER
jgi:hypothetical protein